MENLLDLPSELLEKILGDDLLSRHDVHNLQMVSTGANASTTQYAHSLLDALYGNCKQDARQVLVRLLLHPEDAHVQEMIKLGRLQHVIAFLCEKQCVIALYSYCEFREMLVRFLHVAAYSIDTRARMLEYLIDQGKNGIPGFVGFNRYNLELVYDQICQQDPTRTDVVQLLLQKGLNIGKYIMNRAVVNRALDILAVILEFVKHHHIHDRYILANVRDMYEIVQQYAATLQTVDFEYLNTGAQNRFIFYVKCMSLMSHVIPKI